MNSLRVFSGVIMVSGALLASQITLASDWPRFRGPNGSGVNPDSPPIPEAWSETENMRWKVPLPGPGSSSPIVVGDRVFVTCWTGYGTDEAAESAELTDLRRHLLCIDRRTGQTLWTKSVEAVLPEEEYRGMFTQHGYASHTPVSDGERVFVFFGKTGVVAFDMQGNQLWQAAVGSELDRRGWGSASSPILYKNLVIVPAMIESEGLVALDKTTGEEVWRQEAEGFASTWGSPILVDVERGEQDLVLAVPYEIWGFNPETGKLRWYCESVDADSVRASAVAHEGIVYFIEGRQGQGVAVRAGGRGDVSGTHVVWTGRHQSGIGTPVAFDGQLYWVTRGIANSLELTTGQRVYQTRMAAGGASAPASPGEPESTPEDRPDGERRRGGFGGGFRGGPGGFRSRGPGGGQDYSSPVVADGKVFFVTRSGTVHVYKLGKEFGLLRTNSFPPGSGDFSATPAISNGDLLIRSTKYLYCVSNS